MLTYKCPPPGTARITWGAWDIPSSPPLTPPPQFLGTSWGICIFNLFPHEFYTSSSSLGHPLSLESPNNGEIMFSYWDTISSFLFVSTPSLAFYLFSAWYSFVEPPVLGMEEEQRGFCLRDQKSLFESPTLFRQGSLRQLIEGVTCTAPGRVCGNAADTTCFVNI